MTTDSYDGYLYAFSFVGSNWRSGTLTEMDFAQPLSTDASKGMVHVKVHSLGAAYSSMQVTLCHVFIRSEAMLRTTEA